MSEEGLLCPICMERFNDSRRPPLILGCGHTFCRECLTYLHQSKQELKCPQCNKVDSRSVGELPKNFILSEIILKAIYSGNTDQNPWSCKLHPSEDLAFISQKTRQLFCSECLSDNQVNDLVPLEPQSINTQSKACKDLYDSVTSFELGLRAEICCELGTALEGHKLRVLQKVESQYLEAMQALDSQFNSYKEKVEKGFEKETNKLNDAGQVFELLKEMKTIGLELQEFTREMSVPKQLQLIGSLMHLNQIGVSSDLKKLLGTPFEHQNKFEVSPESLEVPASIIETPKYLIKGIGSSNDTTERKLSRFSNPTNRWGIFEGRKQVEAVSFTVNKDLYITAIGVGNAYYTNKTVKLEYLAILQGASTGSPSIYQDCDLDLQYDGSTNKVYKVNLKRAIRIEAFQDYSIKLMLKGEAGVFRGGSTSRDKTTDNGVIFKFKSCVYENEEVKNGENADDGPIFDIHFKMSLQENTQEVCFWRYEELESTLYIESESRSCFLEFSFDKTVFMSAVGLCRPSIINSKTLVRSVKIYEGSSLIHEMPKPVELTYSSENSMCRVYIGSSVKLKPSQLYTLKMEIRGPIQLYSGKSTKFQVSSEGVQLSIQNSESSEPIAALFVSKTETETGFEIGEVPPKISELAGGEVKLARFEDFDKQWHLNNENQVESFSFNFSEEVLLTAIGLGNCVKTGSFITVESIQILYGVSTAGPVLYNSKHPVCLYNHTDTKQVVKVSLEPFVRISSETTYTIRVVMKGEGKAYKGKKFKGSVIKQPNGIILRCLKSRMSGNDKRNGDNESAGPIFDFYYIAIHEKYTVKQYSELVGRIFPKLAEPNRVSPEEVMAEEYKVCRYSSTGSSWHVNTDGKQVEAISFKVSSRVYLSALGIGNAYEEGRKVTVKKIQVREGTGTKGKKIYEHPDKEKLINIGEESRFVRVALSRSLRLNPDSWYTVRVKYKPGTPICRGTSPDNHPAAASVQFDFEKAKFDQRDVENGSHEVHGPLKDFYFYL